MTTSRWFSFVAGGLAMWAAWSCQPASSDPVPDEFHADFPLAGAHVAQSCEACHIDGAREQGLTPERASGWVNAVSTSCLGCHADTTAELFPGGHKNGASCADAGCHSASDFCWRQVWAECGPPGEPPPPPGHVDDLARIFPLEGAHGGLECGACHPGGQFEPQRGGGVECTMCHERPSADHYPPLRAGADPKERGCKACHAIDDVAGKLQVPADWNVDAYDHRTFWPHAVADFDANPPELRAEADWTVSCASCHEYPQSYANWACGSCHPQDALLAANLIHNSTQPCIQCHPEGK